MLKEWPLVAFTILGQTAVGAFLLLFPLLFLSPVGTAWNATARSKVLLVWGMTFGLGAIATGLSMFHLHHPLRARRALANFRTSWLSREIFFELVFMALVALAIVLAGTGHTAGPLIRAVMAVAAIAGILFLGSMSKLYMLESVPPWDTPYIGISFVLTAVILGAMATAWITGSPWGDRWSYFSVLWTASFFFIAADFLLAVFITPVHGLVGYRPTPSLRPPARVSRFLYFGRLGLLAGGFIAVFMAMRAEDLIADGRTGPGLLLPGAFALVLASEIAGRFLFYSFAPRPGD